jgi:ABC-2 type transport system permease protein
MKTRSVTAWIVAPLPRRVRAIMENEWGQLLGNKVVVFTTVGPPMVVVAISLIALFMSSWLSSDFLAVDPRSISEQNRAMAGVLKDAQDLQREMRFALLSSFMVLFQMIPLVVPISIASHSIVGEKQGRSLEPLLATPVGTGELLFAKALSAAIPGVLATWYGFAAFAIGARFAVSDSTYRQLILSPTWLTTIMLLTPLFTLLAVGFAIIISSRVKDPNSAQQLGSLVILPLIGLMVAQIAAVASSNPRLVLMSALVIALIDFAILSMAVRLFRREEILTTWR